MLHGTNAGPELLLLGRAAQRRRPELQERRQQLRPHGPRVDRAGVVHGRRRAARHHRRRLVLDGQPHLRRAAREPDDGGRLHDPDPGLPEARHRRGADQPAGPSPHLGARGQRAHRPQVRRALGARAQGPAAVGLRHDARAPTVDRGGDAPQGLLDVLRGVGLGHGRRPHHRRARHADARARQEVRRQGAAARPHDRGAPRAARREAHGRRSGGRAHVAQGGPASARRSSTAYTLGANYWISKRFRTSFNWTSESLRRRHVLRHGRSRPPRTSRSSRSASRSPSSHNYYHRRDNVTCKRTESEHDARPRGRARGGLVWRRGRAADARPPSR